MYNIKATFAGSISQDKRRNKVGSYDTISPSSGRELLLDVSENPSNVQMAWT